MTQFYILRRFERVVMEKDEDEDDVYGDVLKGFENLEDLLQYCKEQKNELEIHYEYDTTWKNNGRNVIVVFGYDYTIVTLDQMVSQLHKLKGESFHLHKYTY